MPATRDKWKKERKKERKEEKKTCGRWMDGSKKKEKKGGRLVGRRVKEIGKQGGSVIVRSGYDSAGKYRFYIRYIYDISSDWKRKKLIIS